jgi:uncharacterized protein
MKLRDLGVSAIGAVLFTAGPCLAQKAATADPPAASSPKSEALVRRYLTALHYQDQVMAQLNALHPNLLSDAVNAHPDTTPEQREHIREALNNFIRNKMLPKLAVQMAPAISSTYSDSELEAIIAFYESPVGQAFVEKGPVFYPKAAVALRAVLPELEREMEATLCAAAGCPNASAPPKPGA